MDEEIEETDRVETDFPTCPWCGHEREVDDEIKDGEYDCEECGKIFMLIGNEWNTYTTRRIE
jgi:hypothetical protein